MTRLAGFWRFLFVAIPVVLTLNGRTSRAEPLQFVNDGYLGPSEDEGDDNAPGFGVELLKDVLAGLGHEVSIEIFPFRRAQMMVIRGERDGILATLGADEEKQFCSFPEEPLVQDRWVLFVRKADIGKLKFSSFDDLSGHDVAIGAPLPGSLATSPELLNFLHHHNNLVTTNGTTDNLRMLAAGRVDYALANLSFGMGQIAKLGLSRQVEPLLSRSVTERGIYVCFSRARISPALVDAFSQALKQFKRTETYRAIYRKYFP